MLDDSLCIPPELCGNAQLDNGEECDGGNLAGLSCADFGYNDGVLGCTAACRFDLSGCVNEPACGNGVIDGGEQCDGAALGGKSCLDFGYAEGTLGCTAACAFSFEQCTAAPSCGDGSLDSGEQCDGPELNGMGCEDFGYSGGMLTCTPACAFSFDQCQSAPQCGDGVIAGSEQCDGADLGGQTCADLGFDTGTLVCSDSCTFDTTGCEQAAWCGNGTVDAGEQCDGAELNGATCQSQGFDEGDLSCTSFCMFDLDGCYDHPPCGNGVLDAGEVCDGDTVPCQELDPDNPSGTAVCLADCSGIQKAAEITGAAHMEVMRMDLVGLKEWEVKDVISQVFDEQGSDSSYAFSHIVASGPNALSLHYSGGSRTIQDGDLLLMDLGARYNGYCGDISRTIPANGTFTDRQREVYQLVLDAQAAAVAHMRPGEHSLNEMTYWVQDFFRDSPLRAEDSYGIERTMDNFFIHSLGHYIGRDVHGSDLGLSTSSPVQVGQVFTLEPGLYLTGEEIGIRIEDDYVMTEDGPVNIYLNTPKTVDEIEAMMQGKSNRALIDRASRRPVDQAARQGAYTDHMDF
jgi:methionine aminopeptidase